MPQKKIFSLPYKNFSVNCLVEGEGPINCLFIGPGSLYFPTIPDDAKTELFTLYDTDKYFAYPLKKEAQVSDTEIENLTLDNYINYYESCRKALGLKHIAIMGPSAIGLVAHEYARRFPEVISFVILLGTPSTTKNLVERQDIFFEGNYTSAKYNIATSWSNNKWSNFKLAQKQFEQEKEDKLTPDESLIKELVADQEKYSINPEPESVLRTRWQRFNTTMRKHFFENMISAYEMEGEVIVPTLAISGLYDGIAPFYDIGDKITNRTITGKITQVILEDAAHSPQFESKQFTQCIRKWINDQNPNLLAQSNKFKL